ncbi:ISWI one complex protein 3 [Monosporozyma servazzii]
MSDNPISMNLPSDQTSVTHVGAISNNIQNTTQQGDDKSDQNKSIIETPQVTEEASTDSHSIEEMQRLGLRRSTRVPKPRAALEIDFGPERPYKKRKKSGKKPGPKTKVHPGSRTSTDTKKEQDGHKVKVKKSSKEEHVKKNVVKKVIKPIKKLTKKELIAAKQLKGIGLQEPSLTETNWSANSPLLSTDFKNQVSVISRLKSPNTKPVYYAGDIIKLMAFINKFSNYFGSDLLGLSFQDFEVGLDLYPAASPTESKGIFSEEKGRFVFYQDYILIKEVIAAQDKMNLVFITLLKLLFSEEKSYNEPPELQDINPYPKKECQRWLNKLRNNIYEWGYPKEWRNLSSPDRTKFESKYFDHDDTKLIDPKVKEILNPNLYHWPQVIESEDLLNPFNNTDLDSRGILALDPVNRIIMLRTLIDFCGTHSTIIHSEIQKLSHFKRDPAFGVKSQHAPRYFIEGTDKTMKRFKELCKLVESRYEIRSKKKHYKKLLKEGKQPDLKEKLDLIREIKETLHTAEADRKDDVFYSLYAKWVKLFEGEIVDNPLANPYTDPIYKLRCEEFFIGRIPRMGDFYIPRLHSYGNESKLNTFTDLRNLTDILNKFSNGVYDSYALFENFGQNMSGKFKVLYHDTPSLISDVNKGKSTDNKVYWYEMCHDSKTLKEFIELLDYKIAMPIEKPSDEKTSATDITAANNSEIVDAKKIEITDANNLETTDANKPETNDIKTESDDKKPSTLQIEEEKVENMIINKHTLPKDAKYNMARNKLKMMREYLSKMVYVFEAYEALREEYGDMIPGKRQLRKTRRQDYTDEYIEDSDNEKYTPPSSGQDNEDEEGEEEGATYMDIGEDESVKPRRRGRPRRH